MKRPSDNEVRLTKRYVTRQQIATLLAGLGARLGGGLTERRRHEFASELASLPPDDDVLLEETGLLSGAELLFVVDVFGSEGEVLEAVFLVPGALANVVSEEAQRLPGKVSMRRIAGMADA